MKVDAARFKFGRQAFRCFKTVFGALFPIYLPNNKNLQIFESGA